MESLPLSILAFAAGVYLLIKVKREYLGSLFNVLAWLVIAGSVVAIGFSAVECYEECCEAVCGDHCRIEKRVIIRGGETEDFHHREMKRGGCHMEGCAMEGCHMEGDSCVMDKEACEKMMGKAPCEAMIKERGRCIMGKEECAMACGGMHHGSMMHGQGGCGMEKGAGEKKGCCKMEGE